MIYIIEFVVTAIVFYFIGANNPPKGVLNKLIAKYQNRP
jgi:hypothetical protein